MAGDRRAAIKTYTADNNSACGSEVDDGKRHCAMTLRIERITERGSVVFVFSGRIRSHQLPDLRSLLLNSQSSVIALDLRNVRLVDRETVRFLASLTLDRIELRNCPEYIREWVAQETDGLPSAAITRGAGEGE